MMERLTRLCEDTMNGEYGDYTAGTFIGIYLCCTLGKVVDRLAYYEDLEEQGRLVVLPCKVGDTVWSSEPFVDGQPRDGGVVGIEVDASGIVIVVNFDPEPLTAYFMISDIGKTVFLTREEAEQALGGAE